MMTRKSRRLLTLISVLCATYLVLLIPDSSPPSPPPDEREPFAWNQNKYWSLLERGFQQARASDCSDLSISISDGFASVDSLLGLLRSESKMPDAPLLSRLEDEYFRLAVLVGACPDRAAEYLATYSKLRERVKRQSVKWDMDSKIARDRLYRLLYGGRLAVEEVMLQSSAEIVPEVMHETDESSVTPTASILGVTIHSGDILVSRGGAPTSALIARGNDYPGNFSHVALAHVSEATGELSIIEAHIECGVAVAKLEDYIRDTKLRIMALRLRSDLSAMVDDPLLPHRAATFALERARREHIPYDFAMDAEDHTQLFCSEVVSEAYEQVGIDLWLGLSHISGAGTRSWLAGFGVRHFITQEPSDLEYDPQLVVVAEWRGYETLLKSRTDDAVVDVMLEYANDGAELEYDLYMLPLARIAKAYSVVLNQFGAVGPVPEGMSATAAMRNEWFSARHREAADKLTVLANRFRQAQGYSPPYWKLIELAREAYGS